MTDMPDWDDDILGEKLSDDVIELTDIVDGSFDESEDSVIELTDIVEDDMGVILEEPVIELDDPVIELTDIVEENTISEPDLALDDVDAPASEIHLGAEDIEAALERVIEKKFADRIETMLFEVMEKVIEKEIMQIKNSLLKDLDQNQND